MTDDNSLKIVKRGIRFSVMSTYECGGRTSIPASGLGDG
jgi:hypothetical protein